MERKDELTILGKKTEYKQDYAPEVLESFVNKHPGNDYWVRLTVLNLPAFVQKPDSLILPRSIFHTFPVNAWWRVNP